MGLGEGPVLLAEPGGRLSEFREVEVGSGGAEVDEEADTGVGRSSGCMSSYISCSSSLEGGGERGEGRREGGREGGGREGGNNGGCPVWHTNLHGLNKAWRSAILHLLLQGRRREEEGERERER